MIHTIKRLKFPHMNMFRPEPTSCHCHPYSVQRIEEFVKQLESRDLKLRVRVLEVAHPLNILEEIITIFETLWEVLKSDYS